MKHQYKKRDFVLINFKIFTVPHSDGLFELFFGYQIYSQDISLRPNTLIYIVYI